MNTYYVEVLDVYPDRSSDVMVVCRSPDGRVGYRRQRWYMPETDDAEDVLEWCQDAEDNLSLPERDWMAEAKMRREDRDE